jgi:hypothetical protein
VGDRILKFKVLDGNMDTVYWDTFQGIHIKVKFYSSLITVNVALELYKNQFIRLEPLKVEAGESVEIVLFDNSGVSPYKVQVEIT